MEWLGKTPKTLGNAFFWLAGLHALAAPVHQRLLHDSTLLRMLPLKALPP